MIQEYRETGIQEHRNTGILEYKIQDTGILEYKIQDTEVHRDGCRKFNSYRDTGIQRFGILYKVCLT